MKISKIILYDEPAVPQIQIEKIKEFVEGTFQVTVELRGNFFRSAECEIFKKIATARVFDLKKEFGRQGDSSGGSSSSSPSGQDIQTKTKDKEIPAGDTQVLYDGFELCSIITEFLPDARDDVLHIIFTDMLTATFDDDCDFRYHARAIISSNPTIISTSGIIEAPAKPKQYYLDQMTNFAKDGSNNSDDAKIKERYRGEFLEYHDQRLSQVMEGYVLQSIVYYETGEEAFCDKKECRLFNAHWQKDLLYSQIENKKICEKHLQIIKNITG